MNISLLKIPFEKYMPLEWLSEFYKTLLHVSYIGANSFPQFQIGASNWEKDKYFKK